ncbi:hypothetical protein HanRHA438_Chr17g0814351 [Helianthus annuus]|nr:hypothetical protein HanIR_Chr17g0872491 [Helianthus annuus]KAJ0826442.1 hypothetical protein HanRHA438_Chr17g0814351 [Helianthus annuus]
MAFPSPNRPRDGYLRLIAVPVLHRCQHRSEFTKHYQKHKKRTTNLIIYGQRSTLFSKIISIQLINVLRPAFASQSYQMRKI